MTDDSAGTGVRPGALALRAGMRVEARDASVLLSSAGRDALLLSGVSPGLGALLARLAETPVPVPTALAGLDPAGRRQLAQLTRRLPMLLANGVLFGDREMLRIEPRSPDAGYDPVEIGPDTPVRLSAFAYLHVRDGVLVLESPLTAHRCLPVDPAARAVITALDAPATAAGLACAGVPVPVVTEMLAHLAGAGFVDVGERVGPDVRFAADADEALCQWEFHDLLMHTRNRSGCHDEPSGGLFPFDGQIQPQPAVKPRPAGPAVELHRPTLAGLLEADPKLVTVMEARRSIRAYGTRPVTAHQLGEFLYRVARIRATCDRRPPDIRYEISSRPYPGGGAAYELELYLTVRRCEGIDPGIYYYHPADHRLYLVNPDPAALGAMIREASRAVGDGVEPDIAITITSRFQRLSWKYRSIAYAVTLKNVGVLYQSMYLVATAMGLAPCALGNGNLVKASQILGLDSLRESSVGEFMLGSQPETAGSRPDGPPAADWHPVNDPQWQQQTQRRLSGRRRKPEGTVPRPGPAAPQVSERLSRTTRAKQGDRSAERHREAGHDLTEAAKTRVTGGSDGKAKGDPGTTGRTGSQ
ncbi:MAG TPA: SagB family peptide dehydrogenase [Streptosporangiaceae bacterium]